MISIPTPESIAKSIEGGAPGDHLLRAPKTLNTPLKKCIRFYPKQMNLNLAFFITLFIEPIAAVQKLNVS